MIDKLLNSRRLGRFFSILLVLAFLLAVGSFAYPRLRKAELIGSIATQNLRSTEVLAKTISYLEGDTLTALTQAPAETAAYKRLSGLLTAVNQNAQAQRLYVLTKSGKNYIYVLDNRYRDNAKPGTDYFPPGSTYNGAVADGVKPLLDKVYANQKPSGISPNIIAVNEYENVLVLTAPITSSFGEITALLVVEIAAGNTNFTKLGLVDFNIVFFVSAAVFAGILLLKILFGKWRKHRIAKAILKKEQKTEEEKQRLSRELAAKEEELEAIKREANQPPLPDQSMEPTPEEGEDTTAE